MRNKTTTSNMSKTTATQSTNTTITDLEKLRPQITDMQNRAFALMKRWCDKLLTYEVHIPDSNVDSGLICPACHVMHGRISDLVYPLVTLYDRTKESKYLEAAARYVDFAEHNLLRPDGSYRNDVGSTWKGITVFSAIALGDTLRQFKSCLPFELYKSWFEIFKRQSEFIFNYFASSPSANINYYAGGACALALATALTKTQKYRVRARSLSDYCLKHFDRQGLFYGEIHNHDTVTQKGCHGIDMGYDLEESLPLLIKYATLVRGNDTLVQYAELFANHLAFMLPDGGIDNSFGTRHNKWTYWGSRTSDGVIEGLAHLLCCQTFADLCDRALGLWERCTYNDLLSLPMADDAGEPTCLHHSFCHAKALAALVNEELPTHVKPKLDSINCEENEGSTCYQSHNLIRVKKGNWRVTFSSIDIACYKGSENSGGSMTLLWNAHTGPICAATMSEYNQSEPLNMQYLRHSDYSPCMTPRLEINGKSTVADMEALLERKMNNVIAKGADWEAKYGFHNDSITVIFKARRAKLVLPIICDRETNVCALSDHEIRIGKITITADKPLSADPDVRVFNQVGGFEYVPITSDFEDRINIEIEVDR